MNVRTLLDIMALETTVELCGGPLANTINLADEDYDMLAQNVQDASIANITVDDDILFVTLADTRENVVSEACTVKDVCAIMAPNAAVELRTNSARSDIDLTAGDCLNLTDKLQRAEVYGGYAHDNHLLLEVGIASAPEGADAQAE